MGGGEITLLAALLAGVAGSAHCLGMCGGISAALGMAAGRDGRTAASTTLYALLYSGGRILSYCVAGAIVGALGAALGTAMDVAAWSAVLRIATAVLLVLIGLRVAFNLRVLNIIESAGARLWARLAPVARRLIPVRTPGHALALGMLWGWLPCGLVYSILLLAATTGSAVDAALVMAAFGLGTTPAVAAAGMAGSRFSPGSLRPAWRRLAGIAVIGFGVWTAAFPLAHLGGGHHHHGGPAAEAPAGDETDHHGHH